MSPKVHFSLSGWRSSDRIVDMTTLCPQGVWSAPCPLTSCKDHLKGRKTANLEYCLFWTCFKFSPVDLSNGEVWLYSSSRKNKNHLCRIRSWEPENLKTFSYSYIHQYFQISLQKELTYLVRVVKSTNRHQSRTRTLPSSNHLIYLSISNFNLASFILKTSNLNSDTHNTNIFINYILYYMGATKLVNKHLHQQNTEHNVSRPTKSKGGL